MKYYDSAKDPVTNSVSEHWIFFTSGFPTSAADNVVEYDPITLGSDYINFPILTPTRVLVRIPGFPDTSETFQVKVNSTTFGQVAYDATLTANTFKVFPTSSDNSAIIELHTGSVSPGDIVHFKGSFFGTCIAADGMNNVDCETITTSGNVTIGGNTDITGDTDIDGDVSVGGDLECSGSYASFSGYVDIGDAAYLTTLRINSAGVKTIGPFGYEFNLIRGGPIAVTIGESAIGTIYDHDTQIIGNDIDFYVDKVNNRVSFTNTDPYAYKTSGGSWGTLSDERLKKDIRELKNATEKIKQISKAVAHFRYKKEEERLQTGFIAQRLLDTELSGHVVEVKNKDRDIVDEEKVYAVNPDFVPYIVSALAEIIERVEVLEKKLGEKNVR